MFGSRGALQVAMASFRLVVIFAMTAPRSRRAELDLRGDLEEGIALGIVVALVVDEPRRQRALAVLEADGEGHGSDLAVARVRRQVVVGAAAGGEEVDEEDP